MVVLENNITTFSPSHCELEDYFNLHSYFGTFLCCFLNILFSMAIVNLIIKPFTSFVLYRMYQDRGGNYSDFGIGGIPGMPNLGGSSGM